MIIRFQKEKHKPSILTCIREDGSKTWTKLNPAIEIHDLAHYVIETELNFKNAFYGLIARGFNIQDFELPLTKRPEELIPKNLSNEALFTEHLVNLLQIHLYETVINYSDFLNSLETIITENKIEFPEQLTQERLEIIFNKLCKLNTKWTKLSERECLELFF